MTPYRVLVKYPNEYRTILVAMLSKNRTTGERRIFILDKPFGFGDDISYETARRVAHMMNSKGNSMIQSKYVIKKNDECTRYIVYREDGSTLPINYYIQSDCLIAALRDYIDRSDTVIQIIDVV